MSSIIGGIKMERPIIVGGGVCKNPASILPYMKPNLPIGAIETGSYTPLHCDGNQGTLAWPADYQTFIDKKRGLNSYGMPNCGNTQAFLMLESQAKWHTRPVLVNFAGSSVDDYVHGADTFGHNPEIIAGIVGNGGCPNKQDKILFPISYDLDTCRRIFDAIGNLNLDVPFWWKESPTINREQLEHLQSYYPEIDFSNTPIVLDEEFFVQKAKMFNDYPFIRAVIYSNTLGNCIIRDENGNPVTTPNGGKAGLSGEVIKILSAKLINTMRPMLNESIDLIHSGGILTGDDVVDCLGWAKAVQCTSGPFWYGDGPRFFANLVSESEALQLYMFEHHMY